MNPLRIRNPKTGDSANSEDPDEMPHYVAFHQGLHCLLRQNQSLENEVYFLEISICDPSMYTMDHPDLIISNFMGDSIDIQKVKRMLSYNNSS